MKRSRIANQGIPWWGYLLFVLLASSVLNWMFQDRVGYSTLSHRQKDPALQTALDELKRLNSFTEAGLTYTEYSDRLLTATGNINVALQHTSDTAAKSRIQAALNLYIAARDAWKDDIDHDYNSSSFIQELHQDRVRDLWREASNATKRAAANDATRREIDKRETEELVFSWLSRSWRRLSSSHRKATEAEAEQKRTGEEAERETVRMEESITEQKRIADEATAEQKQKADEAEAEQKRMAEEAERERVRRFSPEGTAYNLERIVVPIPGGLAAIPPGSEVKVRKNSDGTLHIQAGDLAADVPSSVVTNDRDLATKLRSDDESTQRTLGQWGTQQRAIGAEQEKQKYLRPTPTPYY